MSIVNYVYADSINRTSGAYGNSYTLSLTTELKNIEKVELLSATIPHVSYNITNGLNIITVNGTTISIPNGFYTASDLASYVTKTINITQFVVDYLSDQGIFMFSYNASFTISFNTPEIQLRMGFGPGTLSSVDHATTLYTGLYPQCQLVYSSKIIDLSTTKFVFLDIEELRHSALIDSKVLTTQDGTYVGSTIQRTFAAIPMDIIPDWTSTKVFKKDYEYYIKYDVPLPSLTKLTIRWLDYNGQLLNFNGMERNCFLLRVFSKPHFEPPPDKKESEADVLVKKMQRMIDDSFKPPPPEKKGKKWLLLFIPVIIALFFMIRKFT